MALDRRAPPDSARPIILNEAVAEPRARLALMSAATMLGAAPSREKLSRLRLAPDLLTLGLRLTDTREGGGSAAMRAYRYRDGLIIALLIACPMRIRNLTGLVIGQHLIFDNGRIG